jgi:hypothetical protein
VNVKRLRAHIQFVARPKRICSGNGHIAFLSCAPELTMITDFAAARPRSRFRFLLKSQFRHNQACRHSERSEESLLVF